MKASILLLAFFISAKIFGQSNASALIIANSDYQKYKNGWNDLESKEDIVLIKEALLKQGFTNDNIHVITNATRKQITDGIKTYLIDKAHSGGISYFHYSGHGQQIADDNKDENDGYDEALVPIDAPMTDNGGTYNGDKHLRDDELGYYLDLLRAKLGPEGAVLVTIDACVSGTATRGDKNVLPHVRGTALRCEAKSSATPTSNASHGIASVAKGKGYADMAVITAASKYQLDYEHPDRNCGSLSYAFNYAFTKAPKGSSYKNLFEDIRYVMNTMPVANIPQFEGNMDKQVLGNKIKGGSVYYEVMETDPEHNQVKLNGGAVNGLYAKTQIAFYKHEVQTWKDTSKSNLLGFGMVIQSNISSAIVKLDRPIDGAALKQSHAFVNKSSFAGIVTKIKVEDKETKQTIAKIIEANTTTKSIEIDDSDYALIITKDMSQAKHYDLEDLSKNKLALGVDMDSLFYRILEFGRAKLLLSLKPGNTNGITFNLLTGKNCKSKDDEKDGRYYCDYQALSLPDSLNAFQFHGKDTLAFRIANNLPTKMNQNYIHYMLFEISPKYSITPIFPVQSKENNYLFGDCQLMNMDTLKPYAITWVTTSPYGQYQLRLLVSQTPFNADAIISMYMPEGIKKEAEYYITNTRGKSAKGISAIVQDPIESNLQLEKISGAIDIYYNVLPSL